MAEKTTTKKTTTRASTRDGEKTTAAKKTTSRASTRDGEKTTAKKTTARAAAPKVSPAAAAAASARKAVTVRKRTAATVSSTAAATQMVTGWRRFRRKTKVGVVISAKQPKTVIVTVARMREHPLYKKVIRLRKGFAAHDEAGDVREGDLVRIQESRPYSATKRWRVVEVLSRVGEAGAAAPRVEDIEKQLEMAEGVAELTRKPADERAEESEEQA
ncbi:MAG TPA: 30S ribosomal protein S17 [Candidatus Limnocylindria bacterium]